MVYHQVKRVNKTQIINYHQLNDCLNIARYHGIEKNWRQQDFAACIANNDIIMIAVQNQNIVGHIIQRGCLDSWDILDLFVIEKQRRKGIGEALIKNVQKQTTLHSPASIFLEVASNKINAQKLYRKNNFVVVGERKGYYQKGKINALQMRWEC